MKSFRRRTTTAQKRRSAPSSAASPSKASLATTALSSMAILLAWSTTATGFGGSRCCRVGIAACERFRLAAAPTPPTVFLSSALARRWQRTAITGGGLASRRQTTASSASPSPLRFRGGGGFERAPSSLFASTDASVASAAADDVETTPPPPPLEDDDEASEVDLAARSSMGITGCLPPSSYFGGLSYLDTSSLGGNGDAIAPSHRVLFVLGGPGAGKGTQSERIVSSYRCVHLSAGELLRAGAEKPGYPHAALVKKCLVEGNIVPVAVSLDLLRTAMDEKAAAAGDDDNGESYGARIFLVDGFPRNYDNLSGWMQHMTGHTSVLGALVYDCPVSVLEARILARAETSGRSDDNLDSARRRFETFRKQTEPVVRALERTEELQAQRDAEIGNGGSSLSVDRIDGTGTVEEVWEATREAMDGHVRNDVLTVNAALLRAVEAGDVGGFGRMFDEGFLTELKEGGGKTDDDGDNSSSKSTPMSLEEVFETYEGPASERALSSVQNLSVDIRNGTNAVVSYDRQMKKRREKNEDNGFATVREIRAWRHGSKGWRCIHFSRRALDSRSL